MKDSIRMKILFVGEPGVGKTCIVNRIAYGKFQDKYQPTIQIDFATKKIERKYFHIVFNMFDVSGHPEFIEQRHKYYTNADAVVIVYDSTDKNSLTAVGGWAREAKATTD